MKLYVIIGIITLWINLTTATPLGFVPKELPVVYDMEICADYVPQDPFQDYKDMMGYLESRGNYKIVNRFGYMGKYQFGKRTLKGLVRKGYLKTDNLGNFLEDVELQEKAMDALIQYNLDFFERNDLLKYIGRTIGGVKISLTGMLAGAHLVGPTSVKRYLKSNGRTVRKDGNNMSIKTYMNKLYEEESYDITRIVISRGVSRDSY